MFTHRIVYLQATVTMLLMASGCGETKFSDSSRKRATAIIAEEQSSANQLPIETADPSQNAAPLELGCSVIPSEKRVAKGSSITLTIKLEGPVESAVALLPEPQNLDIKNPISLIVQPAATSTYLVKVISGQSEQICQAVVEVSDGGVPPTTPAPLPAPNPQPMPMPFPGPSFKIAECVLKVSKTAISSGEPITVTMTTSGSVAVAYLDGGVIPAGGIVKTDTPIKNKIYTGSVLGAKGESKICTAEVQVQPKPGEDYLVISGATQKEPVDIVFLVDTSRSMQAEINKLKDSLNTLATRLSDAKVAVSAYLLSFDKIESRLSVVGSPGKIGGAPAKMQTPSTLYSPYQITRYSSSSGSFPGTLQQDIPLLPLGSISSEPGLCLAMDFLRHNVDNPSQTFSKDLHFILMSDEENGMSWDIRSQIDDSLRMSYELICGRSTSAACKETKRYSTYYSWKKYCYDYNQYSYSGKYRKVSLGMCQKKGFNLDGVEDVYAIRSNKECRENLYRCEDRRTIKDYSCKREGKEPFVTATKYSEQYKHCEVARNFNCQLFQDSQLVTVKKTRLEALSIINSGGTCEALWDIVDNKDLFFNEETKPGVRSCKAYSCDINSYAKVEIPERNKATLDTVRYACESTPARSKSLYQYPFNLTYGSGKLTGVEASSCPDYSFAETLSYPATVLSNVCASELNATASFPAGLEKIKTGTSESTRVTHSYHTTSYVRETADNIRASIANSYAIPLSDVDKPTETVIETRNACQFDRPITASIIRSQPEFKEAITEYADLREDNSIVKAEHPNFRVYATRVKKFEPDGLHSSCTREETQVVESKPDPATFIDMIARQKSEKNRAITFHSLVNQTGLPCPGDKDDGVQAKGSQYQQVSNATKGASGDVCAPDFNSFASDMANTVTERIDLKYCNFTSLDLSKVSTIHNETSDKAMIAGTDYSIVATCIEFTPGAVKRDDKIKIKTANP